MNEHDPYLVAGEMAMLRSIAERVQAAQSAIDDILRPHQPQARFDDQMIPLTPRFVGALIELMRAQCSMMEQYHPSLWWWGRCTIHDLAGSRGLEFQFGGRGDLPADSHGRFAVIATGEEEGS